MLLQTGTTTVADIEAVPDLLPEVWEATPLRIFSFLEMTGIRARREPCGRASRSRRKNRIALASALPRLAFTARALLHLARTAASQRPRSARKKVALTTHVAESAQEFEMFVHARGAMHAWLKRNERDMTDCGLGSPVEHLARNGMLGENLLAVHANYLGPRDVALLAGRKVSVVHCPRSHFYFKHRPFPLGKIVAGRGERLSRHGQPGHGL